MTTREELDDLIAELAAWPDDLPLGPRMKRILLDHLEAERDRHIAAGEGL